MLAEGLILTKCTRIHTSVLAITPLTFLVLLPVRTLVAMSVFYGLIFTEFQVNIIGVPMIAVGTGFCVVSFKAISRITFQKGCLRRRDRQFNKVADKLNEAIQSSNQ